jgi:hypothetical protein
MSSNTRRSWREVVLPQRPPPRVESLYLLTLKAIIKYIQIDEEGVSVKRSPSSEAGHHHNAASSSAITRSGGGGLSFQTVRSVLINSERFTRSLINQYKDFGMITSSEFKR